MVLNGLPSDSGTPSKNKTIPKNSVTERTH